VVMDVVRAIREIRAVNKIPRSQKMPARVAPHKGRRDEATRDATTARQQGDEVAARMFEHMAKGPGQVKEILKEHAALVEALGFVELQVVDTVEPVDPDTEFSYPDAKFTLVVSLVEPGDAQAQRKLLTRDLDLVKLNVERLTAKLANEEFRSKAPRDVVRQDEERLTMAQARLQELTQRLRQIS